MGKTQILILFCFFLVYKINAQKPIPYTKCEAIKIFLNSEIVVSHFKYSKSKISDSTITIIDMNNNLVNCDIKKWRGLYVNIVNSGPIIDSLMKVKLGKVIGDRGHIYVLTSNTRKETLKSFYFVHGVTGVSAWANVKHKRNRFYLGLIRVGVQ